MRRQTVRTRPARPDPTAWPGRQRPRGTVGTGGDRDGHPPRRRPVGVHRAESDPARRWRWPSRRWRQRSAAGAPVRTERFAEEPRARLSGRQRPAWRRIGRIAAVGEIGLDSRGENRVRPPTPRSPGGHRANVVGSPLQGEEEVLRHRHDRPAGRDRRIRRHRGGRRSVGLARGSRCARCRSRSQWRRSPRPRGAAPAHCRRAARPSRSLGPSAYPCGSYTSKRPPDVRSAATSFSIGVVPATNGIRRDGRPARSSPRSARGRGP